MFNIYEKALPLVFYFQGRPIKTHLSFTSKEGLLKEQFVWNVCLLVG